MPDAPLTDVEKLARLRLIRTENVGPVTYRRLVQRYGSAARALDALPDLARKGGRGQPLAPYALAAAEREMEQVSKYGAHFVFLGTADYPARLAQLDDAPPVLCVAGDVSLLSRPSLGIVGARNASLAGRRIAADFAAKIAAEGFAVISGCARGIDAEAHRAALPQGTIGVVAGGIDVIYPPENADLHKKIAAQGALVAESPFGTEPLARHFPRRNRIIAGLSLGVLVVEAAMKSGSLITARLAAEQGREVFAVPGSPLDPRASGPLSLIRDGAHMAATAADVLYVLKDLLHSPLRDAPPAPWGGAHSHDHDTFAPPPEPDADMRNRILETLSFAPVQVDALIRAVGVPAPHVLSVLLELELAGRVERHAGNKVNLL